MTNDYRCLATDKIKFRSYDPIKSKISTARIREREREGEGKGEGDGEREKREE